jgi:hypothetical protein
VFPQLGSIDIPFSSYPLKAKYVELMGKDKGYNLSHAYFKVKGGSIKNYETFSNNFGKGFENAMMQGEKMDSRSHEMCKLTWNGVRPCLVRQTRMLLSSKQQR